MVSNDMSMWVHDGLRLRHTACSDEHFLKTNKEHLKILNDVEEIRLASLEA